jgi:hypothetical protein
MGRDFAEISRTTATPVSIDPEAMPGTLSDHGMSQNNEHDINLFSADMPPSSEMLLQASEMSLDSLLKWPIFSEVAPNLKDMLQVPTVEILGSSRKENMAAPEHTGNLGSTLLNLDLEVLDHLVGNFLAINHTKNPILDVESLRIDVREFAESGPKWNGKSCLIVSFQCPRHPIKNLTLVI